MVETAVLFHAFVQSHFSGVSEGRMPQIMRQSQCFAQILIQPQHPAQRPRDLRNFQRMGQPCPQAVAFVINEHLSFGFQPSERFGMDNSVAVALETGTVGSFPFGIKPPPRFFRKRRV